MKQKKIVTFALCFLTAATSFAIGIKPLNLSHSMKGKDCGNRSNAGSAEALGEISCRLDPESCLHKAAWDKSKDNSMVPVSTEKGVGAAQVTFVTTEGISEGTQVAPGCFLIPAHGPNLDVVKKLQQGKGWGAIVHYPMQPENMIELNSKATYSSPRLNDASSLDQTSDYIFIKIDNPVRPKNFIIPARATDQRVLEASKSGDLVTHLFRPKTVYNTDENNVPDFNQNTWALNGDLGAIQPYRQVPLKVTRPCDIGSGYGGLLGSNCPTEIAVSGSPYVTNINNQDLLIGIHGYGGDLVTDRINVDNGGNTFIQSSHVCEDYENVCGQPCVELDEVLPPDKEGISI